MGNTHLAWWARRTNIHPNQLYSDAKALAQAFSEYLEMTDQRYWEKVEAIKSGIEVGSLVKIPAKVPYQLSGFLIYMGLTEPWWEGNKRSKTAQKDEIYLGVMVLIESIVKNNQIEGAMLGFFNARLVAAMNAIGAKVEVSTTNINLNKDVTPLSPDVIKQIAKSLEDGI